MLRILLICTMIASCLPAHAQDENDLLQSLEKKVPSGNDPVIASFKGTRLVNLHTVETLGKGSLDFRISHRFGDFSTGANNLWGLDGPATLRLGFDYSVTNRFTLGIGRSSYGKLLDGFMKYRILRQTNDNYVPISMTGLVSINLTTATDPNKAITGIDEYQFFSSRLSYMYELMIARKFNKRLTLQLAPIFIHYNLVQNLNDKNDMLSFAGSGRFKITRSIAITAEYVLRASKYSAQQKSLYHNAASVGIDIETGGHVFQLFVTNATAINEVQVIPYTTSSWGKGQIRLGFNISRVFGIHPHKAKKENKNKQEKKTW